MKPPLQIDKDVFRDWLLMYFDAMRNMETEIMVYRGAIEILKKQVGAPQDQEGKYSEAEENPQSEDDVGEELFECSADTQDRAPDSHGENGLVRGQKPRMHFPEFIEKQAVPAHGKQNPRSGQHIAVGRPGDG